MIDVCIPTITDQYQCAIWACNIHTTLKDDLMTQVLTIEALVS
jgi:hypothetical protein